MRYLQFHPGMLVLQDFEAMTPNILARTVETVEGGGIICILLHTVDSLKQLYTMTMDVHSRYRTEVHTRVVNRFNERFLLSLADHPDCLVIKFPIAMVVNRTKINHIVIVIKHK